MYCVRCYTHKDKKKVPADMVFKGASCCLECVDEVLKHMQEYEEKQNSTIVKPREGVH